ncbi:hypothetical protein [Primorskyibacter flagellatus]|nr:hypothetical protein [Primorskyibacter flagellatus]
MTRLQKGLCTAVAIAAPGAAELAVFYPVEGGDGCAAARHQLIFG